MSKKIVVVVIYRVARPFVYLFQVLVVVYAANLLKLIAPCLPTGLLQFLVLAVYNTI